MKPKGITLKGHTEGLNIIVNLNAFEDEKQMLRMLKVKLAASKKFYKGADVILTTQIEQLSGKAVDSIKAFLYNELEIKECTFQAMIEEKKKKKFDGVYEGKTKFVRKSIRSGQVLKYNGNLVIIGDINPGAEVTASGNIIVMGAIKGRVHAGAEGSESAVVAALSMQPTLVRIAGLVSLISDAEEKPSYPEVVRIDKDQLVIEPYLPNKFL